MDNDFYVEETNGKTVFFTILIFIVVISLLIGGFFIYKDKNSIHVKNKINLELGDVINKDINYYLKNKVKDTSDYDIDLSKIPVKDEVISEVGEYKIVIKYKNKYVGNNSNDGNLISNLPLSEYGFVFEIDLENLGLIIDYHITDWYINNDYYLEKSLLYNTVSIFSLIDNVNEITFNFSGKTYKVNRSQAEKLYPNYDDIVGSNINKDNFNKYLENKMNDDKFVASTFEKIFS